MHRHGNWGGFSFEFGPKVFGFRAGHRGGRRQWFGSGDMKYVILRLLQDKPRHGYEVMKELEERMHGCYSPSPGTVYPTLQWLEDEGLVKVQDVNGKKVYEITDQGRAFLDEHKDVVEEIFDRVKDAVDDALGGAMADVNRALGRLMRTAVRTSWKARDEAIRKRVAEILEKAQAELDALATK
ncbi:MAG TPA: PadR family transcriptional regulator [Gemmatimonadales bacterium]|nr:PadR family transcriptional regulator [Gemmatimonadales bacterium]